MRLRLDLNILERSLVGNYGVEFDATVGDEDNLERRGPNETEDFRNFPFDGLGVFHRIDLAIGIIGKFHRLLTCVRNQYNNSRKSVKWSAVPSASLVSLVLNLKLVW